MQCLFAPHIGACVSRRCKGGTHCSRTGARWATECPTRLSGACLSHQSASAPHSQSQLKPSCMSVSVAPTLLYARGYSCVSCLGGQERRTEPHSAAHVCLVDLGHEDYDRVFRLFVELCARSVFNAQHVPCELDHSDLLQVSEADAGGSPALKAPEGRGKCLDRGSCSCARSSLPESYLLQLHFSARCFISLSFLHDSCCGSLGTMNTPSMPLSPKPPGTKIPWQAFSFFHTCETVKCER